MPSPALAVLVVAIVVLVLLIVVVITCVIIWGRKACFSKVRFGANLSLSLPHPTPFISPSTFHFIILCTIDAYGIHGTYIYSRRHKNGDVSVPSRSI